MEHKIDCAINSIGQIDEASEIGCTCNADKQNDESNSACLPSYIFWRICFWIGIAMIIYDWLGHLICLVCISAGETGAYLWNTYSQYIYPSYPDVFDYDLHWSIFFLIALILIIGGYRQKI